MAVSANNPDQNNRERLADFIGARHRLAVLSGAGISAGSGIPTYRDRNGLWLRSDPITHQAFVSKKSARQRYWLRSYSGWPAVQLANPSISHLAISALEQVGKISQVITQNVDRLHQKAGSNRVIDLHGRLDQVICMDCRQLVDRQLLQQVLLSLNPFLTTDAQAAPDGDADVPENQIDLVTVPECERCGGTLKPHVVFFGDNVEKTLVQDIYDCLDDSDGLLVVGTSLKVFSGYRFCRYAAQAGLPILSVNPGISRGEDLMQEIIRADADEVLGSLLPGAL